MERKSFFGSRKFIVFLISVIAYSANAIMKHMGLPHLPMEHMPKLLALVTAWLVAQGIADKADEKTVKDSVEVAQVAEAMLTHDNEKSDGDTPNKNVEN